VFLLTALLTFSQNRVQPSSQLQGTQKAGKFTLSWKSASSILSNAIRDSSEAELRSQIRILNPAIRSRIIAFSVLVGIALATIFWKKPRLGDLE